MIKAILFVILTNAAGEEFKPEPKQFDSIVTCQRAAKANIKAMAIAGGDLKIKAISCKPVVQ